jgi:hypothetical protein
VQEQWLLVRMETVGASATLPVQVWRSLRELGARYMHASVCVLPERSDTSAAVTTLVGRVRRHGGELRVFHIRLASDEEQAGLIERFSAERQDEYGEVVARTRDFLAEIAMERARGRAIYTEVTESDADLRRLERWLESIRKRDYFDAPGGAEAIAAVEECKRILAEFEAEAYRNEIAGSPAEPRVSSLRLPERQEPRDDTPER